MQAVELALVLRLLVQEPRGQDQHVEDALPQRPLRDVLESAAQVAHDPAGVALEPCAAPCASLELTGVGVPAGLRRQPRRQARIALPQLDPGLGGERHQLPPRRLVEPGVGRVGDVLLHDRGVDRHPLDALVLDRSRGATGLDRRGQQPLHTFFADALAPAGERGRIDRRTMLKESLTAEMLVVRVLDPPRDHRLVRQGERVLEIEQPRHQPRRRRRSPFAGREEPCPLPLEELPVDQRLELHQLVAHVDQVDQARPQQIILLGVAGLRFHRRIRNRRVPAGILRIPAIRSHEKLRLIVRNQRHPLCSG